MHISDSIRYIGVDDTQIDLFEGQYAVPQGMSYNSYLLLDEKVAVFDTVDAHFGQEWLSLLHKELGGRTPDYLIVQHMEPDHSANIAAFLATYPDAVVAASRHAFTMIQAFFGTDYADRRLVVKTGDSLCLGSHTLTFVEAPMVHWPEVIVTYEQTEKVLFSADAFGKFGTASADEDWLAEARRYYIGIVGKYGMPVQSLLAKASALDIQTICPLHGPVLTENLSYYIGKYDIWSRYAVEEEGTLVAYTSIYGNTQKAALALSQALEALGEKVVVADLARCDMAQATADAFRFGKLALCTTTYNADIFPPMKAFLDHLCERGFRSRTIGLVENGSWAPQAAKLMQKQLSACKDLAFLSPVVTLRSALTEENQAQLQALASALHAAQ